jgi:serine phosphatase RsbU (regulator of sigma subunit)/pSer/pThr/pTyr-binding forkhead associated (FHA) protein
MATLKILKGVNEGTDISLDGDRFILGRNPDCNIVIPITSVSREHAQILRIGGKYFIQDGDSKGNPSRNKTFVNNQEITARTPLNNNDRIRICDFLAAFMEPQVTTAEEYPDDHGEESDGSSTIEAMLNHSSHLLLEQQPAEKLRGLLEISGNLSKTLELDQLLPKIVENLFQLFRQADRCFIIQVDDTGARLIPKLIKTRRAHDEENARFSRSIVRKCMETAQAFLSDDASRDDRVQLSQSVVDFKIRSVMCVPLVNAEGKGFGVIQLDTQDRSKKFTQDDLKLLCGVANQASIALENARLLQEAVARERVKRDLELAHQVQLSFLPRTLPQMSGYEFCAHYESALEVGGDYYGFIPLPPTGLERTGRLAIALGDVAGKGVPAALLMAKLSSDTRFSLLTEADPARAVGKLNDLLYEFTSQMDRFVTFLVALIDPATHDVTVVNAGHNSPLVYRKGGKVEFPITKNETGVPLGIDDGVQFQACSIPLGPGDSLFLFTDGIPESMNVRNEQFGVEGMQAALAAPGGTAPKQLGERIVKATQAHASGRSPHDDITLVGFGRTV